ncbi:MAG TPA: hypothetical protein VKR24_06440, partial [Candidatus Limnocylindrales bacterium]|nr:hypothetical protein [Candidatus Limnocylindrales bacterium]
MTRRELLFVTPRSQPAKVGRQALYRLLAADPRHEPLFPTTLLDLQAASGDPVDVGWLLAAWSARTASPVLVGGPERRAAGRRADYPWPLTIEAGSPRPAYLRPNDAWHAWRPAEAAIQ